MAVSPDWYKTFFTGVALDLWRAVASPEMTKAEADFIEQACQLTSGARVLDVPCGNGRLSVELARRGYRLTGVDIAPENIAEARTLGAQAAPPIDFHQDDMRQLPWPRQFDAAFSMGNSFGYLEDPGDTAFISSVAGCLKPGGHFLIDTGAVAEAILPNLKDRPWYDVGGLLFLIENQYDQVRGRLDSHLTFVRDGKVEKRSISQRVYTFRELHLLLTAAGFDQIEGFSGLDRKPFRLGAQRLLLTARKT
jgi:SAM-dependent methyltransferase